MTRKINKAASASHHSEKTKTVGSDAYDQGKSIPATKAVCQ